MRSAECGVWNKDTRPLANSALRILTPHSENVS